MASPQRFRMFSDNTFGNVVAAIPLTLIATMSFTMLGYNIAEHGLDPSSIKNKFAIGERIVYPIFGVVAFLLSIAALFKFEPEQSAFGGNETFGNESNAIFWVTALVFASIVLARNMERYGKDFKVTEKLPQPTTSIGETTKAGETTSASGTIKVPTNDKSAKPIRILAGVTIGVSIIMAIISFLLMLNERGQRREATMANPAGTTADLLKYYSQLL